MSNLLLWDFLANDIEVYSKLSTMPENIWLVTARFICGVVLHMGLQDELKTGLNLMKFSLNHDYRFENYQIAFLAGFMQATMIFVVEVVNFFAILTATSILDVVMNFMALAIIAEFDDFFFAALGDDDGKKLLAEAESFEPLCRISRTTSIDAKVSPNLLEMGTDE